MNDLLSAVGCGFQAALAEKHEWDPFVDKKQLSADKPPKKQKSCVRLGKIVSPNLVLMFDLFIEGGWEFMSLVTLMALAMFFFAVKTAVPLFSAGTNRPTVRPASLYYVRFFGMLALVTGVLGQLIGLYEAMKHIAAVGEIPQGVLAGGIKVSSICTLYGFIVFLLAHLIWFALDLKYKNTQISHT